MPRYEIICERCQKPFELIMTIAEREKADTTCPRVQGDGRGSAVLGSHGADGEAELMTAAA